MGGCFFLKTLTVVQWANWYCKKYGPEYRLDSRLLVVYGTHGREDSPTGVAYFEWNGKAFRLLRFDQGNCAMPTGTDLPLPKTK